MPYAVRSARFAWLALLAAISATTLSPTFACAQTVEKTSFPIEAGNISLFARYYAPYAIQAAAAYACEGDKFENCVKQFHDAAAPSTPPEAAPDVSFAVSKVIADPADASKARKLFRAWSYQFGFDGTNLGCLDAADSDCKNALPSRWRSWSSGSGPAFQVWGLSQYPHTANDRCSEFSIAFRGTLPGSSGAADWAFGNAAPVSQALFDDYYHQLKRNLNAIVRRIESQPCYRNAGAVKPQLVSVGHSLGGGLAEFVALAHRRIVKAFSFDPSPVTGAYLIDKQTRDGDVQGLTIDRIYQYGEALSYLRDLKQGYPPSGVVCNPRVRTVHVDADNGTALDLHSINTIATHLVQRSFVDQREGPVPNPYLPPDTTHNSNFDLVSTNNCPVRYRYRVPYDEIGQPVATTGAAAVASATPAGAFTGLRPLDSARQIVRDVSPGLLTARRADAALFRADASPYGRQTFGADGLIWAPARRFPR